MHAGLGQEDGDLGHRPLGLAAQAGLRIGRLAGRVLGALEAVERVVEREPIVASGHGLPRLRQRVDGRLVFGRRVLISARGTGGIDRALRLVHFLVGRFVACRGEQRSGEAGWQQPAGHVQKV